MMAQVCAVSGDGHRNVKGEGDEAVSEQLDVPVTTPDL